MSNKTKFTTRIVKSTGEVFAIFFGKLRKGKFECYFHYDDMHGELDSDFIRNETKPTNMCAEISKYLTSRGYENLEYKSRMNYN